MVWRNQQPCVACSKRQCTVVIWFSDWLFGRCGLRAGLVRSIVAVRLKA